MPRGDPHDPRTLFILARTALGLSQRQTGEMFKVTVRTVQRWEDAGPSMLEADWHKLVRAVHPHEPDLAARLAAHARTSLEALGLVKQAPPPPPPQVSVAPEAPAPVTQDIPVPYLVDSVLYAAKDGEDTHEWDPRPMLIRAFRRAAALRLDPGDVADALEGKAKVVPLEVVPAPKRVSKKS